MLKSSMKNLLQGAAGNPIDLTAFVDEGDIDLAIRKYNIDEHMEQLRWLFFQRKMDPGLAYEAPKNGFLVMDQNNYPVAAGFLRKCEGNYAMFDGLITDPAQPPGVRNKALDLLTKRLIKAAKGRKILAFSTDDSVIERAKRHGFILFPHSFFVHKG